MYVCMWLFGLPSVHKQWLNDEITVAAMDEREYKDILTHNRV